MTQDELAVLLLADRQGDEEEFQDRYSMEIGRLIDSGLLARHGRLFSGSCGLTPLGRELIGKIMERAEDGTLMGQLKKSVQKLKATRKLTGNRLGTGARR